MSTRRSPLWELASLWPAVGAVVLLAWVAESTWMVGVSAWLSIGIALMLVYWWARRPTDQWGGR